MDWERLKNEAVTMDKEYRKKLEWRNMSQCRREVCISRENLEEFGFAARCPGCMSLLRGTARQAHTQNCRRRVEGGFRHRQGGRCAETREGIPRQSR